MESLGTIKVTIRQLRCSCSGHSGFILGQREDGEVCLSLGCENIILDNVTFLNSSDNLKDCMDILLKKEILNILRNDYGCNSLVSGQFLMEWPNE